MKLTNVEVQVLEAAEKLGVQTRDFRTHYWKEFDHLNKLQKMRLAVETCPDLELRERALKILNPTLKTI